MIDKHFSLLTHLLCLCFLAGCENEYFKTGSIHIQLKKPSGYVDISLANIPVTLINQSIGCVYTTTTDINPAKRNVMVVKNEMRLLKQKRNVLQI